MRFPRRRALLVLTAGIALGSGLRADAASLPLASQNLTTFSACSLVVSPTTTTGEADTYVDQAHATTNNGTGNAVDTDSNLNGNQRIYLSFTLSKCLVAIPSTATVLSASVLLAANKFATTCRTLDIFRVTGTWTETGVTWNTQPTPATTSSNTPASSSKTSSSVTIGTLSTCGAHTNNTLVAWNVTTDVAAFVAGTATNDGWMIRDDAEDGATQQTGFVSREGGNLATAPRLLITYTRG